MSTAASTIDIASRRADVVAGHDIAHEPVSRLGLPEESALPPHAAELFERFRRQYGFVPNWLAALAVNPDTAWRLVAFYEHLFDPHRSRLTAAERELIAVVTSAANTCSYWGPRITRRFQRTPPRRGDCDIIRLDLSGQPPLL